MSVLKANWPAPSTIHAFTTTRAMGFSQGSYQGLNLAEHVGDDPAIVAANRQQLKQTMRLPSEPIWLQQTHSTNCVVVDSSDCDRAADAALTRHSQTVLAIMTADCLPILLCNRQGTEIAAIHAGWRGLANGILESTVMLMETQLSECMAWIGPAICGQCYATGEEVVDVFASRYPFAQQAFHRIETQWYANLAQMAALILSRSGLKNTSQSNVCTLESSDQFYSYRHEAQTGRIASLIWFEDII